MRHENHCFTTSSDSTGRGLVKLTKSYGSWTSIYILSLSIGMQFTNCTTRKPLFHDPYESYESYGSWTCIYTPSPSNDMHFTNCTTRKPLFHDLYDPYGSYGSYGSHCRGWSPVLLMICRSPLFHDLYHPLTIVLRPVRVVRVVSSHSRVVSVRQYWTRMTKSWLFLTKYFEILMQ